jgi:hypothetical protein
MTSGLNRLSSNPEARTTMESELKPDAPGDAPVSRLREDWRREVREKLLEAIHDGPSTPLTQADWDGMRRELRRPHASASTAPPSTPVDEILDPVRREFDESGMSEEELAHFLTEVRDQVRRGKRAPEER